MKYSRKWSEECRRKEHWVNTRLLIVAIKSAMLCTLCTQMNRQEENLKRCIIDSFVASVFGVSQRKLTLQLLENGKKPIAEHWEIQQVLHQHRAPILAESIRSKESKLMKRHAIESRVVTTTFNCSYCKGESRIPTKQNEFVRQIIKNA
jgi:hypothetical protein